MRKNFLIIFLGLCCLFGCSAGNGNGTSISYMQAKEKIINEGAILVDVRTQDEYTDSHIEGAILLPLDTIDSSTVSETIQDKNVPIIVYCKSGVRSKEALQKLVDLGYTNVFDLGAMSNWKE